MSTSAPTSSDNTSAEDRIDLDVVDRIVREHGTASFATIPILQGIQEHFRYLPQPALKRVCEITEIRPAQIEGVASFYSQFRRDPVGEHIISVCHGTACHVAGAEGVTEAVQRHLGLEEGQDTDEEGRFTLEAVPCVGCCSLAPVMKIDDRIYGYLTPENTPRAVEKFLRDKDREDEADSDNMAGAGEDAEGLVEIRVGQSSCCIASGSSEVSEALQKRIRSLGMDAEVRCTSCVGMSHREPMVEVCGGEGSTWYSHVTEQDVPNILRRHTQAGGFLGKAKASLVRLGELLTSDRAWEDAVPCDSDEADGGVETFLGKQKHIVLEGCGEMDPVDIDDYESQDGYSALRHVIAELSPEEIIGEVKKARLRGRGGGGFPTGEKWQHVREAADPTRYVVVNGDEGDPGAFMDRMLLESFPHRVLEGLAITAYAVGAKEGYLYVRAEYPLALRRLRQAMDQATARGYLGDGICGTAFSLKVHIMEGAGAFVCGEETALLASLEGKRGTPRFRPPYPSKSGLWGKPTVINNVETYATIPWIVRNGADEFARIGTEHSKGTKVFALAGQVNRGGLIEVPMGITIQEIVHDIGGGMKGGGRLKAVQIGGPSGGCLPASMRDMQIDYEENGDHNAIMGSGGLVVLDEKTCMVDVARYFLQFTQSESCGKCTFCRIGTKRMLEILERICRGEGKGRDVDTLEKLAHRVKNTSLCGLGQTAPNPVLTTLRYFRDEYEAHLEGRCSAGSCRELVRYRINDDCIGCTLCAQQCPADAIPAVPYERHEIDQEKCTRCGMCRDVCPEDAVEVE